MLIYPAPVILYKRCRVFRQRVSKSLVIVRADNIYTLNSTLFTLLFPRTRGNNKKRGNAPFLLHRQFFAMNVDNDCAALAHGTGQNQVGYFILDRGRN